MFSSRVPEHIYIALAPLAYLYYWADFHFCDKVQLVPKNPWLIKNQPNNPKNIELIEENTMMKLKIDELQAGVNKHPFAW